MTSTNRPYTHRPGPSMGSARPVPRPVLAAWSLVAGGQVVQVVASTTASYPRADQSSERDARPDTSPPALVGALRVATVLSS
jgi:hypothetical protein